MSQAELLQTGEARFYRVDGVTYPSVTTVIGAVLRAPELESWKIRLAARTGSTRAATAIRDEAAAEGTLLHAVAATLAAGQEFIPLSEDAAVVRGALALRELLAERFAEIVLVEDTVVSRRWGYAGTCDLVGRQVGRKTLTLVDFKTRGSYGQLRRLYPAVRLQTAAYVAAARECYPSLRIDDRLAIYVNRDANAAADQRIWVPGPLHDQAHDFNAFASLLAVYRWLKSDHH